MCLARIPRGRDTALPSDEGSLGTRQLHSNNAAEKRRVFDKGTKSEASCFHHRAPNERRKRNQSRCSSEPTSPSGFFLKKKPPSSTCGRPRLLWLDRKSTRLNSSHLG